MHRGIKILLALKKLKQQRDKKVKQIDVEHRAKRRAVFEQYK